MSRPERQRINDRAKAYGAGARSGDKLRADNDTLTAAVDRVRALHVRNPHSGTCEHCSDGDYPDYAVPHPCATIRALDEEDGRTDGRSQ
jgi:hypothetical protein